MKKIEAIIKPFKLQDVRTTLGDIGIEGITVSEVKGFGHDKAHSEVYRGTRHEVESQPEIKIELVVADNHLNAALGAIIKGTKTAKKDDCKILISTVEDFSRFVAESIFGQTVLA